MSCFIAKVSSNYQITAQIDIDKYLDEYYEFTDVNDYTWRYDENYPLAKVCQPPFYTKNQWSGYLANERWDALDQYGNMDKYEHLAASPKYPIIIIEGTDVIDGHHRIALALEKNQKTIPAIVGVKN